MFSSEKINKRNRTYPGKLLLFGEYIIIKGASALAMPLGLYGGSWQEKGPHLQQQLPQFAQYLKQLQQEGLLKASLDCSRFVEELDRGLYFESTIPLGYGAGSSGALCAAVFDRFGNHNQAPSPADLPRLKSQLAQMESFFHGNSSGIDPLVCLVEQALLLSTSGDIQACQVPLSLEDSEKDGAIFLIDTGISRQTEPLVQHFLECCEDEFYEKRCMDELVPQNETAIQALLTADTPALLEAMQHISYFQFQFFRQMIPAAFQTVWGDGLISRDYSLKLCGAGGGGFILGFTADLPKTKRVLSNFQVAIVARL